MLRERVRSLFWNIIFCTIACAVSGVVTCLFAAFGDCACRGVRPWPARKTRVHKPSFRARNSWQLPESLVELSFLFLTSPIVENTAVQFNRHSLCTRCYRAQWRVGDQSLAQQLQCIVTQPTVLSFYCLVVLVMSAQISFPYHKKQSFRSCYYWWAI